jgi:hypothetical protein
VLLQLRQFTTNSSGGLAQKAETITTCTMVGTLRRFDPGRQMWLLSSPYIHVVLRIRAAGMVHATRGVAMSYHATWLKGREVVADDEFEDLLEAQAFVLEHQKAYHDAFGANSVKVWDERAIYFQVET